MLKNTETAAMTTEADNIVHMVGVVNDDDFVHAVVVFMPLLLVTLRALLTFILLFTMIAMLLFMQRALLMFKMLFMMALLIFTPRKLFTTFSH